MMYHIALFSDVVFTTSLKTLSRKTQLGKSNQKRKRVQDIQIINNYHIITSDAFKN